MRSASSKPSGQPWATIALWLALAVGFAAGLQATSPQGAQEPQDASSAATAAAAAATATTGVAGTLTVCARPNAGLLENGTDGAIGFEHDILRSFAESEGLALHYLWLSGFAEMIPTVADGKHCDLGSAAITVTPKRSALVDFSTAYFHARVVLVETSANMSQGPADLAGKRVAVVGGTFQEELLRDIEGVQTVTMGDDDTLFARLRDGEVDALVSDSVILLPYLGKGWGLQARFFLSSASDLAFALPIGSELRPRLNRHLFDLETRGEMERLLAKNFGEEVVAMLRGEEE